MAKEAWDLIKLRLALEYRSFIEYMRVLYRYYPKKFSFALTDIILLSMYLFHNPFRTVRKFFTKRGNSHSAVYGETPLTTMERIALEGNITADDIFIELGSGRGRAAFWVEAFKNCSVVGIEAVPEFVSRAKRVASWRRRHKIAFQQEDMLKANLSKATVIYLYGTCLTDSEIEELIGKLKNLQKGTRIITVSYPLGDYTSKSIFKVSKSFSAPFPWGETDIYIQHVV